MNSQNIFDPNDFNTIETSSQMYYLEVDGQNIIESPVESQAVPLNVLLNSHNDQFYTFIKDRLQNEQLCVYVDPMMDVIDDPTLLSHVNNQRYLPSNGNTLTLPITAEVSSSSHLSVNNTLMPTPSTSSKTSTDIAVQDNAKESKGLENVKIKKRTTSRVQGFVHLADRVVPPRAVAVLPAALQMRRERVMPKRPLPERVRFGPVQGIINTISCSKAHDMVLEAANSKTPLFLLKNGDNIKHIDVSDRDKANWFCLLPLGTQSTANVWLFEEDNKLYGITIHSLTTQTKLALGYSKQYSDDHNLPPGLPVLDLNQDLPEVPRRWWCYDCHRALPTASQLQLHVDTHHKEKNTSMRRYRCRHCTRTFGRRFTLKRHIARYCCQRPDKSDNAIKTYTTPDIRIDTPLNVEDNRLPSDESLQNYTNGLDFSTNLFDTDRMPSLDISGSSRSEIEFNSYGIPYKDDNVLDLEMGKLINDQDKTGNENQAKKQSTSSEPLPMLISCPYCKQTIIREKKRDHLRQCPERQFSCENCGVTYNSVEKLAQHIHSQHPDKTTLSKSSEKSEVDQANGCEYKCETCQHEFKRRGMLVNHMWRVHKLAAQVPLQKRVRHYPCGACPKLYRSAAKRDTHRAHHHPDAALVRSEAIVSGRRACEPAACEACPRQYATRAKLLQHVRQRHPHLAPPLKTNPAAKACVQDRQKLTKRSAS